MKQLVIVIFFLLAALAGCSKKASTGGQTATLALKDGTAITGTVTISDTSSITIQTPNGVVSTYPVSQVSSVNYGPGPGAASNPPAVEPAPQPAVVPPPAPADSSAGLRPAATPATAPPPAREYRPAETFHTIPAGTTLAVRTDQSIDSKTAVPGQTYPGVVARDVSDTSGQVAIPRGASATLVIRDVRAQGRIEGRSELGVDVAAVRVQGRQYRLETLDRLTRSVKDLCTLLERFERRGFALVSVAESLDTGSAAGRLVLNIMTAVSQWEREAIGEGTRDAHEP